MNIDFYSAFQESSKRQLEGKNVVVIDVLRATSVIVTALAGGARSIIPVQSIDEAKTLAAAAARDSIVLAGERDGLPIPGFDLGNSPPLFNPERVSGKDIVLTTMHGTRALQLCKNANQTIIGSAETEASIAKMSDVRDRLAVDQVRLHIHNDRVRPRVGGDVTHPGFDRGLNLRTRSIRRPRRSCDDDRQPDDQTALKVTTAHVLCLLRVMAPPRSSRRSP